MKSESPIYNKVIYNKEAMYSDQKPKDSNRKSEEITQGSGLRKATPSDQKPKDSDRTKLSIYNKVIYNKEAMYSDQKPKDSNRKSEEITQGSGLRKVTPSDQKPKVSDRTKSESPIYNKVIYNKGTMYSDQKPKDSNRKSEEITQGSGLRKVTPSDQKPKVSDRTKSESPIYNKVIYNKGTMYSDQKPKVSDRTNEHIETSYNNIYIIKKEMNNLKVAELREIARSRGLKGWYRLRKSDLISFITSEEQ